MNYGTKYGTNILNDNIWEKIEKNINNKNLDWRDSTIHQTDDNDLLNTEIRKSKNCWIEDPDLSQSLFDEVFEDDE